MDFRWFALVAFAGCFGISALYRYRARREGETIPRYAEGIHDERFDGLSMIRFARAVSVAAHPFVTVGIMVGVSAVHIVGGREAAFAIAVIAVLVIAPLAGLMHRQVRRHRWQNVDASNAAERPILFVVSSSGLIVLLAYLMPTQSRSFLVRGAAGTLSMLAACAVITPWVKVSLHLAFASLAATTLILLGSPVGWFLWAVVPVLAWSRLHLSRHRPVEIALGLLAGVLGGLGIWFL